MRLFRYRVPLTEPIALPGNSLHEREGFLIELTDQEGRAAWGESAPLPGFSQESVQDVEHEFRRVMPRLCGYRLPQRYEDLEGAGFVNIEGNSSVSFAIEHAFLRLRAMQDEVPLRLFLDPEAMETVQCNALLLGEGSTLHERARAAAEAGFRTAKLKVGRRPHEEDVRRVLETREALGGEVALRLDANRAFSFQEALRFSEAVASADIEYIEEPVREADDLTWFAEAGAIPFALDETLQHFYRHLLDAKSLRMATLPQDFGERVQRLVEWLENAAACVWKPSLLHVPHMGHALRQGTFPLPMRHVILSSAFETGVGLSAVASYAAAFGARHAAVGLDTYRWLEHDVLESPLPLPAPTLNVDELERQAARVDTSRLELLAEMSAPA